MEIMFELFLTAFVVLVFSFLIAKFVSFSMAADSVSGVEEGKPSIHAAGSDSDDNTIMEHLDLAHKFKVQSFESEKKVDFVKESDDDNNNKVDVFEPVYDDDQGFECKNKVEEKAVERSKVEAFESEKEVEFIQEAPQVELKAKLDDFAFENKIEEIEAENEIKVQSEESQMKGTVEEEKETKLGSYDDDNDWERIEKSELENVFGADSKFTEQKGDLGIENDEEIKLHGLHKIATEGSCRESQPPTSMLSSSSKWNAWQRQGDMNQEAPTEEQHVTLVSDNIPGLMEANSDGEQRLEFAEGGVPGSVAPDINSVPDKQAVFTHERNAELKSAPGDGDITESTSFEKQVKGD